MTDEDLYFEETALTPEDIYLPFKRFVAERPVRKARAEPFDPLAPELLDDQIKDMKARRKAKELAVAL